MSLFKRGRTWWIDFTTPSGERIRCSACSENKTQAQEFHDKLKAEAAKGAAKVAEAKPMLPVKRAQNSNSIAASEKANAINRLKSSGSIEDAVRAYSLAQT